MKKSLRSFPLFSLIMSNKSKVIVLGIVALFFMSMDFLTPNPPPVGNTGSPSDGSDCQSCHGDFNVNSGPGTASITTDIPLCGYTAGATYSVTATVSHTGLSEFQFQLSPQNASGTYLGTLVPNANTQFYGSKYISGAGTTLNNPNTNSWTFSWTAPATGTGTVTFYASFNAVDGNEDMEGDYVYNRSLSIEECTISIDENSNVSDLNVYPNPTSGEFSLSMNLTENSNYTVELCNVLGQKVYSENLENFSGKFTKKFDATPYGKGLYLLKVKNNGKESIHKVMVY